MCRAESTACLTASSVSIDGRAAPAGIAAAIGDLTRSTRLPATTWPCALNVSIAPDARTTPSNASPAAMRFAASTPPTDSTRTSESGDVAANAATRSASRRRVAIDEMIRTVPS
jgi:hypothetical protein